MNFTDFVRLVLIGIANVLVATMPLNTYSAVAFDHREELTKHEGAVRDAALVVAQKLTLRIEGLFRSKEYAMAADLNRALSAFLESKTFPASLIPDPQIAEEFSQARKASARNVLQEFRLETQKPGFQIDDLKQEMEEFVQTELELQKFSKPLGLDGGANPNDQASKDDRSQADPKVLDGIETQRLFEAIEECEQRRRDAAIGATTTLERTRIQEQAALVANKEISSLIEGKTITLECTLVDSRLNRENKLIPYVISYRVDNGPSNAHVVQMASRQLHLKPDFSRLAESPAGVKFKIIAQLKIGPNYDAGGSSELGAKGVESLLRMQRQFEQRHTIIFLVRGYHASVGTEKSNLRIVMDE